MSYMEAAAVKNYNINFIDSLYTLFSEKTQTSEGPPYCYKNSIATVDGYNIRIAAVSDNVLGTMNNCYLISDTEIN